jgi:hypothetical protein
MNDPGRVDLVSPHQSFFRPGSSIRQWVGETNTSMPERSSDRSKPGKRPCIQVGSTACQTCTEQPHFSNAQRPSGGRAADEQEEREAYGEGYGPDRMGAGIA